MAQQKDGVFTWLHSDHLHSATVLTDANGLDIRRLAYAAFGEEAANSGIGAAPQYTYTGKERDRSGLLYYGARYYDPALARFITADSVYDRGPQGLNRYAYALNNPILYRDPMGTMSSPFATFFSGWHHTPKPVRAALGKTLQAEAQGIKAGMIEGSVSSGLIYTTMAVPGTGEVLDGMVLFGTQSTSLQRIAAGASLFYSLFTLGIGPNYGAVDESVTSTSPTRISQLKTWYKRSTLASERGSLYLGKKYYLNIDDVNPARVFDDVTPGNPKITAGGQTGLGGENPCLANSQQIAEMRGYDLDEIGVLEDILNTSESITPGIYRATLPSSHPALPGNSHWVVVNEGGTLTDVSLHLNLNGQVPSEPLPDTWEIHDYYYNALGYGNK